LGSRSRARGWVRVLGDEHLFNAAQVCSEVFLKAAGEEGTGGVVTSEKVVGTAGAVSVQREKKKGKLVNEVEEKEEWDMGIW